MPTKEEFQELINVCNNEWITNYKNSNINGCLFTLKSDSSKTLFFPAAGFIDSNGFGQTNYRYYLTSLLYNSTAAISLQIEPYGPHTNIYGRNGGQSVRAVKPKN